MATVARRSPPAAARGSAKPVSSGYHGAEGLARMEQEQERQAARKEAAQMNSNMPFRFFCPVGETRQIVVVDDKPDFFRHEHNLKNNRSGKWDIFCACINESTNCPVCKAAERPSYFAMYLTVIDLTPYVNKDDIEVPWSKKLLVVKSAQQKKITRLWQREGTLRGMILDMTRDGEKDASIGNDIEFVEFMEEDELATYETDYVYKDQQGVEKVKPIIGHEVFDYDELFPLPTEQQLRALVGGRPEAGSRDHDEVRTPARRAARGDDFNDPPPARTASRTAPARREIAPEDRPDAGVERPTRAAPSARTGRVARAVEPEAEPEEEAAEPRATARRAAPPARTGRVTRADPEVEPEEAEPPQRRGSSLAERRQQLRGR